MAETPPEQELEHDIDEFDERVTALEDDIDGARELIGDDAEGEFDDPDELAELDDDEDEDDDYEME